VDIIGVIKTRCCLGSRLLFTRLAKTLVVLRFFAFFSCFFLFSGFSVSLAFLLCLFPCVLSLPFYAWRAIFSVPLELLEPSRTLPPSSVSSTSACPTGSAPAASGASVALDRLPPPSRPSLPEIQMSAALTLGHHHRRNDEAIARPKASPGRHPTLGRAASPPPVCSMHVPAEPASTAAPDADEMPRRRRWRGVVADSPVLVVGR
jgi:hypothetical protein